MAAPRKARMSGVSVGKSRALWSPVDTSELDWMARGKCAQPGVDPDDWFTSGEHRGRPLSDHTDSERIRAERLCRGCPVIDECLLFSCVEKFDSGVWGGLTTKDRMKLNVEVLRARIAEKDAA